MNRAIIVYMMAWPILTGRGGSGQVHTPSSYKTVRACVIYITIVNNDHDGGINCYAIIGTATTDNNWPNKKKKILAHSMTAQNTLTQHT